MHSTIWWIVTGISLLGVYSVLEFIYRYRVTSRGKKKIPTQLPLPLIGNALHFLKYRSSGGLLKATSSYLPSSPISAIWFGPKLMVMIAEPKLAQNLLVKGCASRKAEDLYSIFDDMAAGVFATRDVKRWATLRKPVDRLMEPKWVDSWIEVFNKNANIFCEGISSDAEECPVPFRSFEYVISSLVETHLGLPDSESFKNIWPSLWRDMDHCVGLVIRRLWDITIKPEMLFKMSRHYTSFAEAKQRCIRTYNMVLDLRKAHLKENNLDFDEEGCYTDFIMSRAKQLNYDDEETFKFGIDLIAASVHTTSHSIKSAILFLAMHSQYQQKLYDEIRTVFGESTEAPTEEQLNRLQYLDMVIKETLRHTGVPGLGRHLTKDVELDGYIIPKNSILWFNQMLLSYNPKYWERPKEFYPEHFTPEAEAARPKGAFLPFSLGARNCPGKLNSQISMKVVLSKAVQQFEFSTNLRFHDIVYDFSVVKIPSIIDVVVKRRTPLNR